jgi:hypothetical protein
MLKQALARTLPDRKITDRQPIALPGWRFQAWAG